MLRVAGQARVVDLRTRAGATPGGGRARRPTPRPGRAGRRACAGRAARGRPRGAPGMDPWSWRYVTRASACAASRHTAAPSSRSEWPPMSFVAECRTMSAPSVERALAERRRERRVDHGDRAALARAGRDRGDVGDDDERVGDRLHPHHVGTVGRREDGVGVVGRDHADVEAAARLHPLEDVPHAVVRHRRQRHGPTRRHEVGDRGRRREARGERHGSTAVQRAERRLERAPSRVAVAAVLDAWRRGHRSSSW